MSRRSKKFPKSQMYLIGSHQSRYRIMAMKVATEEVSGRDTDRGCLPLRPASPAIPKRPFPPAIPAPVAPVHSATSALRAPMTSPPWRTLTAAASGHYCYPPGAQSSEKPRKSRGLPGASRLHHPFSRTWGMVSMGNAKR